MWLPTRMGWLAKPVAARAAPSDRLDEATAPSPSMNARRRMSNPPALEPIAVGVAWERSEWQLERRLRVSCAGQLTGRREAAYYRLWRLWRLADTRCNLSRQRFAT
jgi:hypothetical protein